MDSLFPRDPGSMMAEEQAEQWINEQQIEPWQREWLGRFTARELADIDVITTRD